MLWPATRMAGYYEGICMTLTSGAPTFKRSLRNNQRDMVLVKLDRERRDTHGIVPHQPRPAPSVRRRRADGGMQGERSAPPPGGSGLVCTGHRRKTRDEEQRVH